MTTLTFDTDTMCIRLSNGSLDAATRCEGFRGFYFLDSTMFHRGYLLKIWSAIASAIVFKTAEAVLLLYLVIPLE